MSICLESNNVLANQVSTASRPQLSEQVPNENVLVSSSSAVQVDEQQQQLPQQVLPTKTVTKLLVSNHQTSVVGSVAPVLQKISNPPVITVLNSAGGPLTVLKTICVTSGVSSAPHFSLVNNQSLTVTNAIGKTPTITLLNAPVTVVKVPTAQQQNVEKTLEAVNSPLATQNIPTIIENRAHNVFVKNTCNDPSVTDVPQGHKFLTASNFSQTNVLTSIPPTSGKTANGQRNKLKVLSNIVVPNIPGTSHTHQPPNLVLNKTNAQPLQRLVPRQKVLGPNGNQTKYVNKLQNNIQKPPVHNLKQAPDKVVQHQKLMYPTHKSQIKTIPPVNNYMPKIHGIKTITPQPKTIPGQVQRTGSGLRTIPPQRPPKLPNKLNYIGKHAVQAQKVKQPAINRCNKTVKQASTPVYNNYMPPIHANKQLAFNQALTAEILETLSNKSGPTTSYSASKNYEILPSRYDSPTYAEQKPPQEPAKYEEKPKYGLDALSLICQAVLLDHNYNATLPPDSPTKSTPIPNTPSQINGMSGNSMHLYSPGAINKNKYPTERKRAISCSNPVSSSSSTSNLSSLIPSNTTSLVNLQDDDATSEISDCSERKHDTEGEETDTAPEAEAVANDEPYDHYGDYVTRCICGFLHDDGYMVECDQCKVWQHVQCVVKNKQVPDEYLCEKCNPSKPVDSTKARLIQQQWLRDRQQLPDLKHFKKENKPKEPFKHKEIPTDTDSSDTDSPRHNNNTVTPARGKTNLTNRKKPEKHVGKQKKDIKEPVLQKRTLKKRERKLVRRKSKLQTKKSEDDNQDAFALTQLPQLRQWIENYEEAVTNHYSPELRARISNIRVNGAHTSDTSVPYDPSVNKCRVHTQPLTDLKYLVATINIPPNTPVIELRGKYMLSTQHRSLGGNLTTRQHAQRPGPFLFFYRLHKDNTEVCVDTRTYGNSARFVRRSCRPNAELRHCIEKGVLHLYIVAISAVDKNVELTIKHESHDLAAVGTTQIACYCGNSEDCKINKTSVKKNGENTTESHRKRRGRRTTSVSVPSEPEIPSATVKEEPVIPAPPLPAPSPEPPTIPPTPTMVKSEPMEVEVKPEVKCEVKEETIEVKNEIIEEHEIKKEPIEVKEERPSTPLDVNDSPSAPETPEKEEKDLKEGKDCNKKSPPAVMTRRSSQHKTEKEKGDDKPITQKLEKSKNKKLSREERKLEAILRAIEQMEKADQRKHEHKQTKQIQRRDSEPSPNTKEEEKTEIKQKRKRRKGRARTTSTHSARRVRLNSGDSYFTSGDENMLSPNDNMSVRRPEDSTDDSTSGKHEGLLLTLSSNVDSCKMEKSPMRENDSNSNSAHSSPDTPLSLACSLVQAAVEPLEPGFKFPKTKKVLMNEWLNKTPDSVQSTPSPLSPHINNTELDNSSGFYTPSKNVSNIVNSVLNETGPKGSAKKRWLRQAISEDKCDSPQESPPLSDSVAPPKKRRLPRESISNDNTPPSTPTNLTPSVNRLDGGNQQEGCVEIVYSGAECDDSPTEALESDAVLKERAAEMKQEFSKCVIPSPISEVIQRPDTLSFGCLMDPRLRNNSGLFSNSDHLVGTVEKTLSILGFEEQKPEIITPAKRKLSITEYRQRKKLNNNDINDKSEEVSNIEDSVNDENNSSESFKLTRPRLNSSSSSSITSSDGDAGVIPELPAKAPAFNSEPTELERQREMQSLRLKKAFGLSIDVEPRKPALDVEAILNCDLPTPVHTIKPHTSMDSPVYSNSGSCEPTDLIKSASNSPRLPTLLSQPNSPILSPDDMREDADEEPNSPIPPRLEETEALREIVKSPSAMKVDSADKELSGSMDETKEDEFEKVDEETDDLSKGDQHDEVKPHMFYTPDEEEEIEEKSFPDIESINYVPPFNNPIYPSTNYTSVIDEEGRYEGRNPSPPPSHLDPVDSET